MLTHRLLRGCYAAATSAALCIFLPSGTQAQDILRELEDAEPEQGHGHSHDHTDAPDTKKKDAPKAHQGHAGHKQTAKGKHASKQHQRHSDHGRTVPHDATHSGVQMHGVAHGMHGFLGPYPIQREGSGTSWLPDATPHFGVHAIYGEWQTMYHALFNLVYDHQGGPRGADKTFVNGMFMGMAQRRSAKARWVYERCSAPDPFMGANGYPLLFATGETADGRTHLIDRQHPHDLFMELATTYSYAFNKNSSVYVYAGLPGEPALGPSAFMHRTSGMDIPEAPITHHWLDSTHITFGVLTAVWCWIPGSWKHLHSEAANRTSIATTLKRQSSTAIRRAFRGTQFAN